jgi:hypothetical protein
LVEGKSNLVHAINETGIGSWELGWLEHIIWHCEMVGDFNQVIKFAISLRAPGRKSDTEESISSSKKTNKCQKEL